MNDQLKIIENAVREIRLQEQHKAHEARNKATYIIWKSQDDRNVKDVNDVVGIFYGTYEEADALLDKLNKADPSVKEGWGGRVRFGYWRSEPTVITDANLKEFLEF